MPALAASPEDVTRLEGLLHQGGHNHLTVRRRGPLLTIVSGPADDPWPRARLRRVGQQHWQLEVATHTGRWEPTPMRGSLDELVELLISAFGWVLEP